MSIAIALLSIGLCIAILIAFWMWRSRDAERAKTDLAIAAARFRDADESVASEAKMLSDLDDATSSRLEQLIDERTKIEREMNEAKARLSTASANEIRERLAKRYKDRVLFAPVALVIVMSSTSVRANESVAPSSPMERPTPSGDAVTLPATSREEAESFVEVLVHRERIGVWMRESAWRLVMQDLEELDLLRRDTRNMEEQLRLRSDLEMQLRSTLRSHEVALEEARRVRNEAMDLANESRSMLLSPWLWAMIGLLSGATLMFFAFQSID